MRTQALKGVALAILLFVPLTGCQSISDNPKTAIGGLGGAATGGLIAAAGGGGEGDGNPLARRHASSLRG